MTTVVFACVHNAGRSQMAAALFNHLAAADRARAISAGTDPGPSVHAEVAMVMRERGIDLAGAVPTRLTDDLAKRADWLVTMGCGDRCPVAPGTHVEDWLVPDPKGRPLDEVRVIRDDVERRVIALVDRQRWR